MRYTHALESDFHMVLDSERGGLEQECSEVHIEVRAHGWSWKRKEIMMVSDDLDAIVLRYIAYLHRCITKNLFHKMT